jgi:glycosyltransferase involved in cell wall biosynthesis
MENLPRLLILSNQIPQTVYAGCILLHRLLRDYPADKLLVIGQKPHPKAQLLACRYEAVRMPLERLDTTRLAAMKRSLDSFGVLPRLSLAEVRRRVGTFKPEVVLAVMESRHAEVAARYARHENIPLVLILHDKQELFDRVYPWARGAQIRANAAIYRTAVRRLCISPEMEIHLRELYGAPGEVLYPNRSEDLSPRPPEESATLRQPPTLTIGYAGTLAYGYGAQLRKLARALRGARSGDDAGQIRLRIFGDVDRAADPLANELSDVVDCRGRISPPEKAWDAVKSECDAVILPYAWEAETDSTDLYRTHFPSKLPEYLALGMPVIVMGPDYATGVRWAVRNADSVLTLTKNDPASWQERLESLRQSPDERVRLAKAALVVGQRDFNPADIRGKFLNTLIEAAKSAR